MERRFAESPRRAAALAAARCERVVKEPLGQWFERVANSNKVMSEMANPSPFCRASLMAALAFLES